MTLKELFDKHGIAINLLNYTKVTATPEEGIDMNFVSDKAEKAFGTWKAAGHVNWFEWISKYATVPWVASGTDCYGDNLDDREHKVGLSRPGQITVASIINDAAAKDVDIIYLYMPQIPWTFDTLRDEVFSIVHGTLRVVRDLTKTTPIMINLYDDSFGGLDDRGIVIINGAINQDKFMAAFNDIGEVMDEPGWTEVMCHQLMGRMMEALKDVRSYGAHKPDITPADINLDLEVAYGVEKTPYTPEQFANRLLTDYGILIDTSAIIRGTRLAKPHKILRALPKACGTIKEHCQLIDRVVRYCMDNANAQKSWNSGKKPKKGYDGYFTGQNKGKKPSGKLRKPLPKPAPATQINVPKDK